MVPNNLIIKVQGFFYSPFVPRPTVQTHCNCFAGLSVSTEVQTHYNNNNFKKKKKKYKNTLYKVVRIYSIKYSF